MDASLQLQRALVAALGADPALVGRGITAFDGAPDEVREAYLSIGADLVIDRGWKGGGAREHRFGVTYWDPRPGMARAKAVLAEVERAVLAIPPAIGGHRLISLRLLRANVRRAARGWTQGSLEFRAISVRED